MSTPTECAPTASARAARHLAGGAPHSPHRLLLDDGNAGHLFVTDASQLYSLSPSLAGRFRNTDADGDESLLRALGLFATPRIDGAPLPAPPLHALSLAVAQRCNLGCSYCYAQQGDFGAPPQAMDEATGRRAIDLLLTEAAPSRRASLSFLGGEPLSNRKVLVALTEYAAARAATLGIRLGFSITSNGTLLTAADAEFFERHGFAVTLSLDGRQAEHDALRPFRDGRGSYARILARAEALLARQRRMQVSVRATVTARNLDLPGTLEHFIALGFHSVGFSPLLRAGNGRDELGAEELETMLGQMIACGEATEAALRAGRRHPFANLLNALREIGRGTHRPYPCGAGAAYLGVSADGKLAACHRFVGDADGALGDLDEGIDRARQRRWLAERHVHRQEPCRSCWARYLCGGGCHHEVIGRGRSACAFIRGWLHYCLEAWLRLDAEGCLPEQGGSP